MPFDANGNFSLVPGTIVADGMNVLPSQHNPPFQDVANGLSQAVVRDGRAPMTGPLNMNGNKITGVSSGDAPTDVVTNEQIADLGVAIGDGKWSARDLSPNWLRRDGSIYNVSEYPALAAFFPALPAGVVWDKVATPPSLVNDIAYGNGTYVAVGDDGYIATSTDLVNWTVRASGTTFRLLSVAYGNGRFVAVGHHISANNGISLMALEDDLDDWSSESFAFQMLEVVYGSTFFLAIGSSQSIRASTDGVSWSSRTGVITGGQLRGVAYGLGQFAIIGDGGSERHIQTSTDTITWTHRTVSSSLSAFWGLNFANGNYIISGASGQLIFSTNLTSWTQRLVGVNRLSSVAFGGGFWVAVGQDGAFTSTNQITWTVNSDFPSHSIIHDGVGNFVSGSHVTPSINRGQVAESGQFQVPIDNPAYGWIRAL